SQTVVQYPTTTVLTSTVNPALTGQAVTITATVATTTGHMPTGTVTITDGGTVIGTPTVDGSGHATLTTSTLARGTHPLAAAYAGDANDCASSSDILTQTINAPDAVATTTTLTSSPNPAFVGQSVTFSSTVAPVSGNRVPTGTV